MGIYQDGKGNIQVNPFTIHFTGSKGYYAGTLTRRFLDYTEGWNWARRIEWEWKGSDSNNTGSIDVDFQYVPCDAEIDLESSWEDLNEVPELPMPIFTN